MNNSELETLDRAVSFPEPLGTLQLDALARHLSVQLRIDSSSSNRGRQFRSAFEADVRVIEHAYAISVKWAAKTSTQLPVAEWLLDNFYVVREQIQDIRLYLPLSFYRQLPRLANGTARVQEIARELATHCDCALDEELIMRFVDGFQASAELTIGESWAFSVMLRVVLIERLRKLCDQLVQDLRSEADATAIVESWKNKKEFAFPDSASLSSPTTLLAVYDDLKNRDLDWDEAREFLEVHLEAHCSSIPDLRRIEQRRMAANQVSMGNIITSMRLLTSLDWIQFFEQTNRAERILREDPSSEYAEMDFASRNRYRDAIEQLSKGSGASETAIARFAIAEARAGRGAKHAAESDEAPAANRQGAFEPKRHIGYWLIDDGRKQLESLIGYRAPMRSCVQRFVQRFNHGVYFGGILGLTAAFVLSVGALTYTSGASLWIVAGIAFLAALPASEIAVQLMNTLITHTLPVRLLPKLDFRNGIPEAYPTFVVIPCLLTSIREAQVLLAKIENHYLANREPALLFALLSDFGDSNEQLRPQDREILEFASEGIRSLNQRYAEAPFFLFHRERRWNESEGKWMGWERKRGKLMEFGRLLLHAEHAAFSVQEGDLARLDSFRRPEHSPFIITLDSDTLLPRDTAKKLVGALAHSLNRPVLNAGSNTLSRGYSILQPSVNILLGDGPRTRYLLVHVVNAGIDPYVSATSDVYQDLFGEGSFTGKGIYDLRAFEASLEGVFPENRILSHDLIEGCYARSAFTSDIQVYDGFPGRYDADARRLHRWVRGDWQIAAWLLPRVPSQSGYRANSLSMLSRWKIFDNMRRSLVAPSILLFLLAGWYCAPTMAWWWSALAALVLLVPAMIHFWWGLKHWIANLGLKTPFSRLAMDTATILERTSYHAAFLPHKAWLMLDAIGRTLYRIIFSHHHLLEWETAAATENRLHKRKWGILLQLSVCTLIAIFAFFLVSPSARLAATPWLSLWLLAPVVGHLIALPRHSKRERLERPEEEWLRSIASGTWAFFERYVNASGNWLPPDNVQEYPAEKVAMRISPTNQGLFLVSGLVAQRMGFIGISSLTELYEKNLNTWLSLEQLHNHHYNWYATENGTPLHPTYVSTVDSGNLAACYLTLHEGLHDLAQQPILSRRHFTGTHDSLNWLEQQAGAALTRQRRPIAGAVAEDKGLSALALLVVAMKHKLTLPSENFAGLLAFTQSVREVSSALEAWVTTRAKSSATEPTLTIQTRIVIDRFEGLIRDVDTLMPWLEKVVALESNADVRCGVMIENFFTILTPEISVRMLAQLPVILSPDRLKAIERECAPSTATFELSQLLQASAQIAAALCNRLDTVRTQCHTAAMQMDFRCLYDAKRKLFSIGYNAAIGKLDRGHYDLLCSEARIASFWAIAKGDVDSEHWFRLGRQATDFSGRYSLLSWGGSMFEFLMPQLFLRSYEGSLIDHSCETAIEQQVAYGAQRSVPWGISESAYSAIASNSDYQYKSFGVPGLGLKRGLSKDLVISPYSSALALPFAVKAATTNLRKLTELALGNWGFYDAVDYTASRMRHRKLPNVVKNYMAHHQGMSLLAIANALDQSIVTRWMHQHAMVRANELLLQEKVPHFANNEAPNPDELDENLFIREESSVVSRQIVGVYSSTPRTILLTNGTFNTLLTHTGGGYAQHEETQITRWRSDPTRDNWGTFIYLKDLDTGQVWSATYQPTLIAADHYEAIFSVDKAEVLRRQGDIESVMEVVVSPEHNAEVRQLRLTNHGSRRRRIEITSYAEIVLGTAASDIAHPAFQKLFVETEYIAVDSSLVAWRRPRDAQPASLFAVHTFAVPARFEDSLDYQTSRENFIGRGHTPENPAALQTSALGKTVGAVLDPIFSMRCVLEIEPHESETIGITTAFATSREQSNSLADQFHDLRGVQRAFELAWALSQIELRHLNLSAKQVHLFQQLGGALLYPDPYLRGSAAMIAANRLGQNSLWRFGISGDHPILLVRLSDADHIDLVKELVAAHRFLSTHGLRSDLVIINDYPGAYFDALQDQIQSIVDANRVATVASNNLFVLRGSQLHPHDNQLLEAVGTAVFRGTNGSLAQQMERALIKNRVSQAIEVPRSFSVKETADAPSQRRLARLHQPRLHHPQSAGEFDNGFGEFTRDGQCYTMRFNSAGPPPAPWSNVIANPVFGCITTESGGGYTWYGNSRQNKLTVWSNDPVSDLPAEILYVREVKANFCWSPTVPFMRSEARRVEHGPGFSRFSVEVDGIDSETLVTIHQQSPLKLVRLRLHNRSLQERTLQITYYADTVLGVNREETRLHQVTHFEAESAALYMHNGYQIEFPDQVAFLKVLGADSQTWTGDRRHFLGRDGTFQNPEGLFHDLNQREGAGLDPCMASQATITIAADGVREIFFLIGAGHDLKEARAILDSQAGLGEANVTCNDSMEKWQRDLGQLQVETPNRAMDVMLNTWLPYQVLSCRVWGRSGFYQAGGAYGFRDQLQDVMALVNSKPEIVREHILRAAARQYIEGDVQHWWHPQTGKGTRTRFSDDFLFLPFATYHYIQATGDHRILYEVLPFIDSPKLAEHEQERYETPVIAEQTASLLEHCLRAIRHGRRYGRHGLPLMGCGDWNDGMNGVGEGGQGESVWVAWFQIKVFEQFANLLDEHGNCELSRDLREQADALRAAIEVHGWDGQWYRRAFFDDGTPLGSGENDECQIDSLAQSWSAIVNGRTPRTERAVQSVIDRLVHADARIIQLFAPPFDKTELKPGYIKGYLPGVRENGGQYTHAAVWMVQAATVLGDGQLAMHLFDLINPILHSSNLTDATRYKAEPFVVAADVYTNPQHYGRGGWSWYTGSAAWMYRVAVENILGIRLAANELTIAPTVPDDWMQFRFTYRRGNTLWRVRAIRGTQATNPQAQSTLPLVEDGQEHDVDMVFSNRTLEALGK